MPTPDLCIAGIYEPGNIGSSTGVPVSMPPAGTLLDPGSYDPETVTYSLDFSKFYNSFYVGSVV